MFQIQLAKEALKRIDFNGRVGYLLDEIPDSLREDSIKYTKNNVKQI